MQAGWRAGEVLLSVPRADLPLDFVALDLRIAINAVGEMVGKTSTEDLPGAIFGRFCLGR